MSEARSPQGCPECDGHLDFEAGETVCIDCGFVVSEYYIDHGPKWHSFASDDRNPARTGAPLTRLRHDRGLSTRISRSTRIRGHKRRQFTHVRRQHSRTRISTKHEHNQMYIFTEIRRMTSVLLLPNHTHDQACSLFESAQSEDLLRNHSLEEFIMACVYAVCRVAGVSRSVEEVYDVSKATKAEHQAAYGALNHDLDFPVAPTDPTEYLSRFTTKLDLDSDTEHRAHEYVAEARDEGLVDNRNPYGVATACLYTAAFSRGENCTQAEAADVTDVTPVTLRKTYMALRE